MTDMNDVRSTRNQAGISRRTVMKGAAWSAPLLIAAVAAPAYAASGKVPPKGLNGWVELRRNCDNNTFVIDGTGSFTNGGTNDRGIWLFAGNTPAPVISGATIIFYINKSNLTFTNSSGSGWSNLVRSSGDDGSSPASGYYAYKTTYTGTWTYHTGNFVDNNGDPQTQVWVADSQPKWTASLGQSCPSLSAYARRTVTVDGSSYSFVRGPVGA
ncbi:MULTISPECIES: hypothetical protein [unclassified Microbacterium]|uniref:hypothetical protein n=1 Tax=unclassified Microbacterium TaxID=2609290 RepID=UPI00203EE80B|nr:hypothetical protein [Microbacterium sp. USTB-Y]